MDTGFFIARGDVAGRRAGSYLDVQSGPGRRGDLREAYGRDDRSAKRSRLFLICRVTDITSTIYKSDASDLDKEPRLRSGRVLSYIEGGQAQKRGAGSRPAAPDVGPFV